MSHKAVGIYRTWTILVGSAGLLSCGPTAPHTRPAPPPKRAPAGPFAQMRTAMQAWSKELKAKAGKKPVDLARFFRRVEGKPVTFPLSVKCKGSGELFEVVASPKAKKAGPAPTKLDWPVLFVHMMAAPSGALPQDRKAYPTPPNNCLVTIQRVKGRYTLVGKPVSFTDQAATIDKAEFIHRGGCRFLKLATNYDKKTGPDGPPITDSGESFRLFRFPPAGPQEAGEYVTRKEEEGTNAYSSSVSGTATWMKIGGLALLLYQSRWDESSQSSGHRSKIKKRIMVEKVTGECELEQIMHDELQRLRKLPGGKNLPKHQIDQQGED